MSKYIGTVNVAGKYILESTGIPFSFMPNRVTEHGIVITWDALEIVEPTPLVGAGEDYGCGKYNGD